MTSDRLLTRPSLTPKMTARSVPDRPSARCHDLAPADLGRTRRPARDGDAVAAGLAELSGPARRP